MGIAFGKIFIHNPNDMYDVEEGDNKFEPPFQKPMEEWTGWDRVKGLFTLDIYGEPCPQVVNCVHQGSAAFVIGALLGGMTCVGNSYKDFKRYNLHEKFETPMMAQKAMREKLYVGFGGGAWRLGWRLGVLGGIYMLSSTMLTAYRNKAGILDQTGAGATVGFLYKFMRGPRAAASGSITGAIFGTIMGSIMCFGTWLLGLSPDDLREWQYRSIEQDLVRKRHKAKLREFKNEEDEEIVFHETYMTADDLSMSKVKNSGISNIVEAVKSKDVSAIDFRALPPVAIRAAYEKEVAELNKANQKPDEPKVEGTATVSVASPSKPISRTVSLPPITYDEPVLTDPRLYTPGKKDYKNVAKSIM